MRAVKILVLYFEGDVNLAELTPGESVTVEHNVNLGSAWTTGKVYSDPYRITVFPHDHPFSGTTEGVA